MIPPALQLAYKRSLQNIFRIPWVLQNVIDFFVKKPLVLDKQRGHKFAVVVIFDYKNAKRDQVRSFFPAM